MKKALLSAAVLAVAVAPALGAAGDWWILPIDHVDNPVNTTFNIYSGEGYNGTDAYQWGAMDGVARIWWDTDNVADSSGATMSSDAELYTIETFQATGRSNEWQPVEVVFDGVNEAHVMDPNIPWAGAFGTNSQWIGVDASRPNVGNWYLAGDGPQAPLDDDYNAPPNGWNVWMQSGSTLFAKWDFGWAIDHTYSAIRITQVTPEPASALLLMAAGPVLLRRRKGA